MSRTKPDVDSVTSKFERAAVIEPSRDRSNTLYHEAMRDADKLTPIDQQRVLKSLVEKRILPDVAVGTATIRTGDDASIMKMHEKGNRSNPRNFAERLAGEMSTDVSHVNRARDLITKGNRENGYEYRTKTLMAAESANAQRHFDSLMTKSGAKDEGKDGLSKKHIDDLLKHNSDLSAGERRALRHLKDNYDKLDTYGLFASSRITKESLSKFSKSEFGLKDDTINSVKRAQIEKEVLDKYQIEVKAGEGYWQVSARKLRESGSPASQSEIARESQRLQDLNPGKTMLHPGDKLRTKSDSDIQREIDRRRDRAA